MGGTEHLPKCLKLKHSIETLHIYGYSNICPAILTYMPHYK